MRTRQAGDACTFPVCSFRIDIDEVKPVPEREGGGGRGISLQESLVAPPCDDRTTTTARIYWLGWIALLECFDSFGGVFEVDI